MQKGKQMVAICSKCSDFLKFELAIMQTCGFIMCHKVDLTDEDKYLKNSDLPTGKTHDNRCRLISLNYVPYQDNILKKAMKFLCLLAARKY